MGSSSFHGTPCLVPAELTLDDGTEHRGFITRLSHVAAAVSSDPALIIGTQLVVRFKRPSDGQPLEARAGVREHLTEGGLWRGKPAALVAFHSPVELEEGEAAPTVEPLPAANPPPPAAAPAPEPTGPDAQPPQQPDEEPATEEQPAVTSSMGSALRGKGLGKRKLAGRLRRPLAGASPFAKSPEPAPQPDVAAALSADVLTSEMESVFFEDDASIPPAQGDPVGEDDATLPPSAALMDGFFSHATPELHSTDSPPPVNLIGEELEATDSFVERFGNVEANFGFDFGGELESEPQSFGSEPGTLPPEFIAPASIPAAPVPTRPDQSPQRIGTQRRRKTDSRRPPLASQAVVHDSAPAERPPWEDEIASGSIASLIPRNARIASTVDVTFWARGRRNQAMADNFSREGLFLNYAGTPPVRGAIVRVEFPVHGADESVSVRFNAEVRWHRSDRPGVGLADGFGVQILTFESPKDRARYEELLDAILALGPGPSTDEGFSWGRPGS